MKRLLVFSICVLLGTQFLNAQTTKVELKEKKNQVIYLSLNENNGLLNSVDNNADVTEAARNTKGKDNQINLYFKWINPLKYKLSWKDSISTDERDKAIKDFVSLLVGQFGTPVSSQNQQGVAQNVVEKVNEKDTLNILDCSFTDKDLLLLLIHLKDNQNKLNNSKDGEIYNLNKFFTLVENFDKRNSENIETKASKVYSTLFDFKDITDYNNPEKGLAAQLKIVSDIEANFLIVDDLKKSVSETLKNLSISNALLKSYINAVLTSYLEKSLTKFNSDKKIIEKLKPILKIVENSTANESSKQKGYYKIRSVEFDNGEKLETVLTISEYEFKKESSDFSKKSDLLNQKFEFRKYDIFDVSVSTGIFYGNTTLKGFGVANDGTNFTVTEDDINKNTAVTAVFLNFNFKTSRYFSPLFQLGIDPTKKRPFMLLGTGFSIPVARIAISGGPIWTWNQSLDKLSVGQTITSTTDLDKDISYKFDAVPKGWYIGIQYNFGTK
ncbi:MAG: hypothetical protein PHQ74_10160 [Crocinitomicaceae bacterium]|nr:hypothetical protein [Crocinitomicaceae bacterium]